MRRALLGLFTLFSLPLAAQHPLTHGVDGMTLRFAMTQPVLRYGLRIVPGDTTGWDVTLRFRGARDTVRLAMATHPEYDERFWRYVRDVRIASPAKGATIVRVDSVHWRAVAPGGEATITYRIALPPAERGRRAAWRPFLTRTGALTGAMPTWMYPLGAEQAPAHVTLDVPAGWTIATALTATASPTTFVAENIAVLMESPILLGHLRQWTFAVDDVPHRIAYWDGPAAVPFDSTRLVDRVRRVAEQAIALFGRAPYRDYHILLQDDAYGALEHPNSVTLGASSAGLRDDVREAMSEIAHEYFHAWNLMRIRPMEYDGEVHVGQTPQSRGLWWSEGVTMLYADLLQRRAGLDTWEPTRRAHLEQRLVRYFSEAGNAARSAEAISMAEYGATPEALGDYQASSHVVGEVLGNVLDIRIRAATDGRRTLDDVLRRMLATFSGVRGFTGRDIERTVVAVCGCAVADLFARHVRGAGMLDVQHELGRIGLALDTTWREVRDERGQPARDLNAWLWSPGTDTLPHLLVRSPHGAWGRAGLHTGDRLVSLNGARIADFGAFRRAIGPLDYGDSVRITVQRPAGPFRTTVVLRGYREPEVRIVDLPNATPRQRALRAAWERGTP